MVLGMSHRGRLNVLANILRQPYEDLFAQFEDTYQIDTRYGDGDVKYHLGFTSDLTTAGGRSMTLALTPNPSHLEAVDPVVEGQTRAWQDLFDDHDRRHGLPLLIHGDAAFAGQGLVAETLNLSQLEGYRTGGTIHIIVNNQIGFTTAPSDARSTTYCSDMAKMIQAPIFHVNAEDPEAAVYVAQLALDFRQTFGRDVVLDLVCYRRHGHNEGDEPSFTQPLMYRKIRERPTLTEIYTEQLIMQGDATVAVTEDIKERFQSKLQAALEEARRGPDPHLRPRESACRKKGSMAPYDSRPIETGVSRSQLEDVVHALTEVPEKFTVHPKIVRLLAGRRSVLPENGPVDWALAEALAFGSLLLEGTPVRLSGQDSRRGTFSQRHAVLYDADTGEAYVPLNHLSSTQASFEIYDSLLSEIAVLGFEYGYALDSPQALVLWEAQFGDFANGAQVIIDQFLVCSPSKWQRDSGLVLLLPHGYEGQGPEHSSARLERFLQLCAEDNLQVCQPTTPAQYFHLLRRQMKRSFRKPLIILTPKSLLRHKAVVSSVQAFTGGCFQEVLGEAAVDPAQIRRVLLCSGKVFYELDEARSKQRMSEVAIVRVEQFYPFPADLLREALAPYQTATEWVWVQEESQNMGGWTFMEPRLRALGYPVEYVGRDASASPATGSHQNHLREQRELIDAALNQPVPHQVRAWPNEQGDSQEIKAEQD